MARKCIKKRIYVSKLNPRMSVKSLNEFGFNGRTLLQVLKNVKKQYPKAKIVCN